VLIELLRQAAAEAPERPAVISAARCDTYAECLQRSEAIARGLQQRGIMRFGCAVTSPNDVVALLAGASAVGSEACVYPGNLDRDGLDRLASAFGHKVLVTDREQDLGDVQALPYAAIPVLSGPLGPGPERRPVLILTTGTTGDPKGARHDWTRLVGTVRRPDETPGTRWLLAYNLNQFGGVQVLLHLLASRATLVAASSPEARDVIEAIRVHGVTHVSATPTFWRLITGRLDAERARELPLEQITLGGEAVHDALLEKLKRLFPQARISQIYGATEFGTAVSVGDGRSGLPLSILERDENAPVRLRIVDGELQMRSRIGMLGYHEGANAGGEWRPTGDVVEVHGDRIHFVGRTSEIINVGGVKVHPLPVEELVCSVEGVEMAAVYARSNPVTGQIVAVDVVAAAGSDTKALGAQIRAACEVLPGAGRPRRVRFVDALELRGHKVVRHQARTGA
jgi:acyl-CoA synthetase (AMP-forming)/AMP-acid ligase II